MVTFYIEVCYDKNMISRGTISTIIITVIFVVSCEVAILAMPLVRSLVKKAYIQETKSIISAVKSTMTRTNIARQRLNDNTTKKALGCNFPTSDTLPADRISARRYIAVYLDKAIKTNQFKQAAYLNSILSQEALNRVYQLLKAWEKTIDPGTKLLPTAFPYQEYAYWSAKDTASDFLPFLILASFYLDRDNINLWVNMITKERKICGPMPCTIKFRPTRVINENLPEAIFGASEYAKDGLLAISERLGQGEWFWRMEEIMNTIIKEAPIRTKRGNIPSCETEVNGNVLQVLSRMYWATQNKEYLEMAERIAEAYLFDVFPKTGYLHPQVWDFTKEQAIGPSQTTFRDHGNEIIPGLTELYLVEKLSARPQANMYRQPLKKFLDEVLKVSRTEDGLWYSHINTKTREILSPNKPYGKGIVDTWGYILNAYKTFDMAEGSHVYDEEIKRVMRAAASRKSFLWGDQAQDDYADSLESMLYQLPWFDIPECRFWLDDEMEILLNKQLSSGFIEQFYLDGNWARTVILYAEYKTQGTYLDPWNKEAYLGASYDKTKKELYIYVTTDSRWKGVLKFDTPRHLNIWHMPFEYPRLNSTPEWFVAEPEKNYIIRNLDSGEKSTYSGKALADGLKIDLSEKILSLNLKVSQE